MNNNNNIKVNMICNAIKMIAGAAVIGYAVKVTKSAWPIVGLMFIPQSSYSTTSEPVNNNDSDGDEIKDEDIIKDFDKEDKENE